MSAILTHLLEQHADMIEVLRQLVELESPTHDPVAVNTVAEYMDRACRALGAVCERAPATAVAGQPPFADHLRVRWGEGSHQVLLLGHMDTVWPVGEVTRRPMRVEKDSVTGARIGTGPGIFDMKAGLVVGLYALSALSELGRRPGFRLVFLFNSDEEVGSLRSRPLIEEEARRSEAVLVLEPAREDSLVAWRKGVGRFELEVQGLASHSGAAHERGVSAVEELAHQILRLEAMTDYGQGTTVNVGVVQGGSKVNVRPAAARASIDLRVMSAEEGERMTEAILGLRPVNEKAKLVVTGGMNRPPWTRSTQSDALFERARRVASTLGFELLPAGAGGGSDGNFTAALGVPTLDGLGVVGDDAHAVTEWADLDSLPRRAALLAELLLDLGR